MNARRSRATGLAAAAMYLLAPFAQARPTQQVPIGVRAQAMGSAYTSIADDASALFWNPAGLPWIGHQEIAATHADLFGTGIVDNVASFVLPLSPTSATALDWYHSGFADTELDFGEDRVDLAYGRRLNSSIALGATVKYLTRSTDLDGSTVRRGHGFGFDVGMIATPLSRLRLGVIGQDLLDTNISYSDGTGTTPAIPMNVRGSISYSPLSQALIAFDADDRWHLGLEARPIPAVALRAGLQDDWNGPDGMTWSAGVGLHAGIIRFDYAIVDHPTLGATNHFGIAMEFNFNPTQVRIEKVAPRDLFASLQKTYSREPVATVRLRNLDDRPLETKVRILIPSLMDAPTERTVVLRPMAVEEIPLSAVLPDRFAELGGNESVQMLVSATYQSARLPRTEKASAKGIVYAPGAIDWSQGVDQAAAFVTITDPVIETFAHDATRSTALNSGRAVAQRNLAFAAAIVDALASLKLAYVPDPNNPYSAISETPRAVDTIAYPRDTLHRLSGDCDDTSVLLAALLGTVGIGSQFVDVPGHIFLLIDTGVHARNRVALGLEEDRTVVADERVWIPIETTSIDDGFAKAWMDGAESFASWSRRGRVALVDVEDALARYEPVDLGAPASAAPTIDRASLESKLEADLGAIASWREAYLATLQGGSPPATGSLSGSRAEIARIYLAAGEFEEAQKTLEDALTVESGSAMLLSNLGTVLAARGDLAGAESRYREALSSDAADPGVWLNLGLVRYAMGDTLGAEEPIVEGLSRSGGYREACQLLSLAADAESPRQGGGKMTDAEARALLKSAIRKVPGSAKASAPKPPSPSGSKEPTKTWTSRVAAGRSAKGAGLEDHLYWKER